MQSTDPFIYNCVGSSLLVGFKGVEAETMDRVESGWREIVFSVEPTVRSKRLDGPAGAFFRLLLMRGYQRLLFYNPRKEEMTLDAGLTE